MPKSTDLVVALLRAGTSLRKVGDEITRKFGLSQQQFTVLFEIYEKKEIDQKQIVAHLVLEKSNVSKMVKKLGKLGLIDIRPSEIDRRHSCLRVTKSGGKTVKACMDLFNSWNEEWVKPISGKEIKQVIRVLGRLNLNSD